VVVDVVPYQAILENLPVQLAAGTGPDIAKVTDLGGLNEYYLDLTPYIDTDYWDASFGGTLDWYRADLTVRALRDALAAHHHRRLRERHPVRAGGHRMPGAARPGKIGRRQAAPWPRPPTPFPMAIDRSGHRVAGPAISYGAQSVR
jgi:alpha-1,4-digalacturonate transport system substrate-binding protein